MDPLLVGFAFVLGACIGSFLNVLTMRLGIEAPTGRSHCPKCRKILRVWELVPLFSYLFLRGRCARCKAPLSLQYPIVELLTAVSFAMLAVMLQGGGVLWVGWFLYGAVIISLSIAILVYDYHHTIVPDVFVYPLAALTFAALFVSPTGVLAPPPLASLAAGPVVAFPIAALWFASRGRWIGFGDAKIALPIGWLLGTTAGFTALALGFWSGALVGVALLGVSRFARGGGAFTMKSEVPFAPFLIFGAAAAYVTGLNFFLIL